MRHTISRLPYILTLITTAGCQALIFLKFSYLDAAEVGAQFGGVRAPAAGACEVFTGGQVQLTAACAPHWVCVRRAHVTAFTDVNRGTYHNIQLGVKRPAGVWHTRVLK